MLFATRSGKKGKLAMYNRTVRRYRSWRKSKEYSAFGTGSIVGMYIGGERAKSLEVLDRVVKSLKEGR
jgi:hypothetical protein